MRVPVKALRRRFPTLQVPATSAVRKRAIRMAMKRQAFFLGEDVFVGGGAWIGYRDKKGHFSIPGGRFLKAEKVIVLVPALTKEGRRVLDGLAVASMGDRSRGLASGPRRLAGRSSARPGVRAATTTSKEGPG